MIVFEEVDVSDASILLSWRCSEVVERYMLTAVADNLELQKKWIKDSRGREDYYHWIIACDDVKIGLINISHIDVKNGTLSFGFYVGESGYSAAVTHVLFCLYNFIFFTCNFQKVWVEVFAINSAAIRLHEKFGFVENVLKKRYVVKNGKNIEVKYFEFDKIVWLNKKTFHRHTAHFPMKMWAHSHTLNSRGCNE